MMLAMPESQGLIESTDAFGKPIQCVRRFDRHLAGFSHPNKWGLDRRALIKKLGKGSKLVLVPEPDNAYDRNAILLYSADDLENDIGYLDSTGANQVCALLERGATFSAEVFYVWYERPDVPTVRIFIYQLTTAFLKHRPIRKGAPVYGVAHREVIGARETAAMQNQRAVGAPEIRFEQIEPEGVWSRLKRLLLG